MRNMHLHMNLYVKNFTIWPWGRNLEPIHNSCYLFCRMDGRGRDKVVSELKVATLGTFAPKSTLTVINKEST